MASYVLANSPPDEDLVRRWRGGEEEAFSLLYHRYRQPVLSTAYRIIRNPEEAQDATQEIFLKVYHALPGWDPGKSRLSTWLYRLAANHSIDRWRVQHRRRMWEGDTRGGDDGMLQRVASEPGAGPYSLLARKEMAGKLRRCIRSLPRLQRRFFVLRYLHGLRLDEIARREGRSIGTVKGLLFRACKNVRSRIGVI
jgi:RNA polymerase sigma-70 factor (ECF subfamily)